jgi:hypothetical protein
MEDRAMEYTVRRTGRTWSVFNDEDLVEGGFFSRAAAEDCANDHEALAIRDAMADRATRRAESGYAQ